ncbi:MAG: class IV adenylate cyclase [Candidatus Sericytochromatia bacterium]|nr:class IV adenylate cyclase [Candidatus Sericytochromatia bacterium]
MEIEVKVFDIDVPDIQARLRAVGCVCQGREFQRNHMYDYPDQRLYLAQDGSYVRLRLRHWFDSDRSEIRLTFKQTLSRDTYKIADESETTVGDFTQAEQILYKLGLVQTRIDEKIRETWLWQPADRPAVHFEIDEWAGLPPYLEVEATGEAQLAEALALLGYTLQDTSTASLREVLASYKIESSTLRFADFGRSIAI